MVWRTLILACSAASVLAAGPVLGGKSASKAATTKRSISPESRHSPIPEAPERVSSVASTRESARANGLQSGAGSGPPPDPAWAVEEVK